MLQYQIIINCKMSRVIPTKNEIIDKSLDEFKENY